jgi:hypothetical protein
MLDAIAPRPGVFNMCRSLPFICALIVYLVFEPQGASSSRVSAAPPRSHPADNLRIALPSGFVPNHGQADASVSFLTTGSGVPAVFLTDGLRLGDTGEWRLSFPRGEATAGPEGFDRLPGRMNYFLGNEPARWAVDLPIFRYVRYHEIFPGVDLVLRHVHHGLEYDLIVAPGANPRVIALDLDGPALPVADQGDLVLVAANGRASMRQGQPRIYQVIGGRRREIEGRFRVNGRQVTFDIGEYDRRETLVIDPVIEYIGSFSGGSQGAAVTAVAVDAFGNTYLAGTTSSSDFPVSAFAPQRSISRPPDCFVAKIDAEGKNLIYATHLGGNNARQDYEATPETAVAIQVDASGNAYVTGYTESTDFPTANAFQPGSQYNVGKGYDGFVTKLDPRGSALVYSTYLGGRDGSTFPGGLAVDVLGNAYVGGTTFARSFPMTSQFGPPGGRATGFVTKFRPSGALVYSARLGGTSLGDTDRVEAVAVDAVGQALVGGRAGSKDFPTRNAWVSACPLTNGFCAAGFVAKLSASGGDLVYSTYIGSDATTPGRSSTGVSTLGVDAAGNAYAAGLTGSETFQTVRAAQPTYGGGYSDGFVVSLTPAGAPRYATYLGGSGNDETPPRLAVDPAGFAHVTAQTDSNDFPAGSLLPDTRPPQAVFRGTDGGRTWADAGTGISSYVNALVFDPVTPGLIYAATRAGVSKTVDHGAHWRTINSGLPEDAFNRSTTALAIDPRTPAILFASTVSGTYKSVDAGARWSLVDIASRFARAIVVDPRNTSTVVVAGSGVRKSTDGGATWVDGNSGLGTSLGVTGLVRDIALNAWFLATFKGVFKSMDGAASWTSVGEGLTAAYLTTLAIDPAPQRVPLAASRAAGSEPRKGRAIARDGGTLFAGGDGVFRGVSAGASWSLSLPLSHEVRSIAVAGDRSIYVGTAASLSDPTGPCVYRSSDQGASWIALRPALPNCAVTAIAIDPHDRSSVYVAVSLPSVPYVVRIAPNGTISYSTFLAQALAPAAIATDVSGNVYLAGGTRVVKITP